MVNPDVLELPPFFRQYRKAPPTWGQRTRVLLGQKNRLHPDLDRQAPWLILLRRLAFFEISWSYIRKIPKGEAKVGELGLTPQYSFMGDLAPFLGVSDNHGVFDKLKNNGVFNGIPYRMYDYDPEVACFYVTFTYKDAALQFIKRTTIYVHGRAEQLALAIEY